MCSVVEALRERTSKPETQSKVSDAVEDIQVAINNLKALCEDVEAGQ